jgi:sulfur relay (sulfurtransferase) DsrF/TusC family protein
MKDLFKKIWPDVTAILLFLLLSLIYFVTPITQGLVLTGSDNTAGIGLGQEIARHQEKTGEMTRWTNAIFSGMPTYQIAPNYSSRSVLGALRSIYELGMTGAVMYVFILLLGFYILMRACRFKPTLSVLGAIIWAFSSYFFIIIGAGHIWKVLTLAFIPPTIAGMVLCYRGKYIWGGAVTALFMAFQILSNHLQMTYYFGFVMLLMFLAYLIQAIRTHAMTNFLKSTGVFAVALIIALMANLPSLYHTYEYSKESMRGKASLESAANPQKSGLSKDYITQWSYGIGETWTLLVPNVKGGASVPIAANDKAMEKADQQYMQIYQQIGQYWGDQPGTSGPVYVGAFVLMLFFLSLFVLKGPMKWCLFAATVLSILLSWGHNFSGLTNFFIDNMPMYNKFRTVASILVIAEFTIPLMAVMALAKIIEEPDALKKHTKGLYISFALTGGVSLLFALFPTAFFSSFISTNEVAQLGNAFRDNPSVGNAISANLSDMRQVIFTSDAWRSFVIILIGSAVLMLYRAKKLKAMPMTVLIALLCLVDMYGVNKRYLNDDNFQEPTANEQSFAKTPADDMILRDKSLDYRVLNFARNTFNENETAFYHKSIGGYHPAKLGRYQDLITTCIAPEMQSIMNAVSQNKGDITKVDLNNICPILNMLNDKYFIFGTQNGQQIAVQNPAAYGNAWFVNQIQYAANPNQEIAILKAIDPHTVAVADNQFKSTLSGPLAAGNIDSLSTVKLTQYAPNELHYQTSSPHGGIVLFSEIFYPGWKATIDGKPLELGRADYVLRAAYVPAGQHKIMMEFRPASVKVTETLAYIALVLLILAFLAALFVSFRPKKAGAKV